MQPATGNMWPLQAAVAAGADGLIIEVHIDPPNALSDGPQSLRPAKFRQLMCELSLVAAAVGRSIRETEGSNDKGQTE